MARETVIVPDPLREIFARAEERVFEYFEDLHRTPGRGVIEISGERYILVRAASLSTEFFELVSSMRQYLNQEQTRKVTSAFLFDLGHALGKADASHFDAKVNIEDPIEKLSAGPVHFAHSGWSQVEILPESNPVPNEEYVLVYKHHNSFEADSWLQSGKQSSHPICFMNAGYSSGWCESSFGVTLVAIEVECRATGGENCRFIMAPPDRIQEYVALYKARIGGIPDLSLGMDLPAFLHTDHLRKELKRERDFSDAVLDNVDALVLVLDAAGRITGFNRACEVTTGFKATDVIGSELSDFLVTSDDQAATLEAIDGVLEDSRSGRQEVVWRTKDGGRRTISWSYTPLRSPDGRMEYAVGTGIDMTDLRRLERQLSQRVEDLAQVNRRLEEVNRELDSFAYSVSHDLRTPLRAMEGFARGLLDKSMHLGREGHEFARRIVNTARQMDVLIQDLLDYSRMSQEELETEPVDLGMLVADVLHQFEDVFKSKKAAIMVAEPLDTVLGNRAILLRVFENLLTNAVKFVRPGKNPTVRVYTERIGECVRLSVEDNGIGIEPKNHERIFQALERLHDKESYPGSGIGLAVVRKGIDRLGGRVGLESTPGEGSKFWIEVPAYQARRAGEQAGDSTTGGDEAG